MLLVYEHLVYLIVSPKYCKRIFSFPSANAHCYFSLDLLPYPSRLLYRDRFLKALFPAVLLIHLGARAEARA